MPNTQRIAPNRSVVCRLAVVLAALPLAIAFAGTSLAGPSLITAQSMGSGVQPGVVASPTASPGPGGWEIFGPPAVYYGLGFAGNGDPLVVGLDQKPAIGPVKLFIARFDATGRQVSRVAADRRYTTVPTGAIVVDPSNDSVLIRESVAGQANLRRVSSATGKQTASIKLPFGIAHVATDKNGRIFGVGGYITPTNFLALIVRLRPDGTLSASYDRWLRSPPGYNLPTRSPLQLPVQIGFGRDGRLVILDRPDPALFGTANTGPPGTAAAIISLTTAIGSPRGWNVPLEFSQGTQRAITWASAITGITSDAHGNVFLGEYIPKSDGTGPLGYRLRMFRKDGKVVASWGYKGDQQGLHWPFAPQVDASGRLWVLDLDPTARTIRIMVLAQPPRAVID